VIGDVRGLGPMMMVELVRDHDTKEPAAEETLEVVSRALANGVILLRAGLYNNGVRFRPPLNMPDDILREALAAVGHAIEAVQARVSAPPV
jgi:4-aminobutyrate aminotransferase/(S)-3-amino-2-methylpropionate transaminase